MNIWIGTHSNESGLNIRRAASSGPNLFVKLGKLATEGVPVSPDETIKITGTWEVFRASAPADMAGICALVEGDDKVIETIEKMPSVTVDEAGEVKKVKASK